MLSWRVLVVAGIPPQPSGSAAMTTWRPVRRSGPGITTITSAAAVRRPEADAAIEVNPDARKCRAGPYVPGPDTASAGLANVVSRCVKGMTCVGPRYAAVPSAT